MCKKTFGKLKHLINSKKKQGEVVRDCAMQTLVSTISHSGHGGDVGATCILVRKWV